MVINWKPISLEGRKHERNLAILASMSKRKKTSGSEKELNSKKITLKGQL